MGTMFHVCINVRNVLKQPKRVMWSNWAGAFKDENGVKASYEEVREFFLSELAKGHEIIPAGKCDNFIYAKGGGCQGHQVEEAPLPAASPQIPALRQAQGPGDLEGDSA